MAGGLEEDEGESGRRLRGPGMRSRSRLDSGGARTVGVVCKLLRIDKGL